MTMEEIKLVTIANYLRPESLSEAYELNQKKANRVLGGMMWLRLCSPRIQNAIDLSGLDLDYIRETEDAFEIGAMCSLRSLETHPGLEAYFLRSHKGKRAAYRGCPVQESGHSRREYLRQIWFF